jgi:cobalamin biosynthesis protein CobD/CbiB
MAYLLGVSLAGPRTYDGERVPDAWMGRGREAVTPADIGRAVRLAWRAWAVLLVGVAVLALVA